MESSQSVARKRKSNGLSARSARAGHARVNGAASAELDQNELLVALHATRAGDFQVRLPGSRPGAARKIRHTFNPTLAANQRIAQQLEHVGEVVGRQGKTRTRV